MCVQMLKDRGSSRGEKDPLFSNVESSGAGFSTAWVKSVVTVSTPHDGSPMVGLHSLSDTLQCRGHMQMIALEFLLFASRMSLKGS